MLHRPRLIAHGSRDCVADPGESRLLAAVLAEAATSRLLMPIEGRAIDLAEATATASARSPMR
jgi:hypothetical protein